MKYISNAKYGEPVETGTIYRGDNKRLDICVHTLCGCGETLYMNCRTLGIRLKRKPVKKNKLAEICEIAKSKGMSYGQYMAEQYKRK